MQRVERRGRSRQVSLAAVARRASEERQRALLEEISSLLLPMSTDFSDASYIGGDGSGSRKRLIPADRGFLSSDVIDLTQDYTFPSSISSSPVSDYSSDYFSHTPSLLDQLHLAYANDDLPLAKILLLRITQNIHDITSRTDPRLDSVKPEDFDVAFLPKGGLMSPEDEARLAERQEKERERLRRQADEARRQKEKLERERQEQEEREKLEREEQERLERERAWEGWVESVWGTAKREMEEMKELRVLAKKRQEDTLQERKRQEEERRRPRTRPSTKGSVSVPRISYAHLPTTRIDTSAHSPSPPPPTQPELLYTLPNIPRLSAKRKPQTRKLSVYTPSPLALESHIQPLDSEAQKVPAPVSCQDVICSMRGRLFPSDTPFLIPDRRDISQHTLRADARQRSKTPGPFATIRRQRKDLMLLAELLEADDHSSSGVDRLQRRRADKRRGKETEAKRPSPPRTNSSSSFMSTDTSLLSPSTASSSRTSSWLSIISSSASSSSTALTTPSSSPPAKSTIRPGNVFSNWLKNIAASSPADYDTDVAPTYTLSRAVTSQSIPVGIDESPLDFLDSSSLESDSVEPDQASADPQTLPSSPASSVLVRSMTSLLDMAKNFQSAYMHATMFAAVALVPNVSTFGNEWDRECEMDNKRRTIASSSLNPVKKLRPVGSRVDKKQVALFISQPAVKIQSADAAVNTSSDESNVPSGFRVKTTSAELFLPEESECIQYIPMVSPFNPDKPPPRTILPNPLPFPIHFKPQRSLTGSPLRRWSLELQQQPSFRSSSGSRRSRPISPPRENSRRSRRSLSPNRSSSSHNYSLSSSSSMIIQPVIRPRFVGNPVYLRLKALENCTGIPVIDTHVIELHEEGVCIKGGVLSCGKEKVLGTAFAEVGRSRLGVDYVRQVRHHHQLSVASLPTNSRIPWWQQRDGLDIDNVHLRWEDGSVRRGRSVVKG